LSVAAVYHIIIVPSLQPTTSVFSLPVWEAILASVIAFYFGERS
jgi:hypothetical protein